MSVLGNDQLSFVKGYAMFVFQKQLYIL